MTLMATEKDHMPALHDNTYQDRRKPLTDRVDELRGRLAGVDARSLAVKAGGKFIISAEGTDEIRLKMWGEEVNIAAPDYICKNQGKTALELPSQALILYYLVTADGILRDQDWISFSDLPDGRFYAQAFQGYTGNELGRRFKDDLANFVEAADIAGGRARPLGDAAFAFELFPRVSLLVVAWKGDEDFPSSYQVLFSGSTPHYLPTDACAIAGSMLTRKIIAAAG